jgi:hypothetical protein
MGLELYHLLAPQLSAVGPILLVKQLNALFEYISEAQSRNIKSRLLPTWHTSWNGWQLWHWVGHNSGNEDNDCVNHFVEELFASIRDF